MLTLLIAATAAALPARPAADPVPLSLPEKYAMFGSRNYTYIDTGIKQNPEPLLKYADFSIRGKRIDCAVNAVCSSSIHIGLNISIFNAALQECVTVAMPVPPTTHNWFVDGVYQGETVVNSVRVQHWIKDDHDYYETFEEPRRQFRVTFPIDQEGRYGQEDTAMIYAVSQFPAGTFDVPDYCFGPQATVVDSLAAAPKTWSNNEPIPFECFFPNGLAL
eukprot:TRINITY_DN366_c0_g1_i2.p1 TRINITY_DN366_c0_g1~~TRINITY_DN366_c0_g1_i2.p1  ORF type:complete len:228 (-),score=58.14 TRINITY_DN366_c0_g1_i2:22-678(-)